MTFALVLFAVTWMALCWLQRLMEQVRTTTISSRDSHRTSYPTTRSRSEL